MRMTVSPRTNKKGILRFWVCKEESNMRLSHAGSVATASAGLAMTDEQQQLPGAVWVGTGSNTTATVLLTVMWLLLILYADHHAVWQSRLLSHCTVRVKPWSHIQKDEWLLTFALPQVQAGNLVADGLTSILLLGPIHRNATT